MSARPADSRSAGRFDTSGPTAPPQPGGEARFGPRAALERLDAALDPADYTTALTTGPRHARLSVTSRHAQIGDDIWADHRAFYWSWGEWIAPISDPATAARMVSVVLRALPQPARD